MAGASGDAGVAVIGAGVVGLACAWELARGGADVTVFEAGKAGAGVSSGNTGWICPSITSPLPAPGMLREGVRQLVTRGDAFVLRPRLDPAFLRWVAFFARSCSASRYEAGTAALLELNRRTFELYDAYRDAGLAFEMHKTGMVVAAASRHGLEPYVRVTRLLRRLGYDGRVEELDRDAAADLEPALDRTAVPCALHAQSDRYVRPEALLAALADALRKLGVALHEDTRVDAVVPRDPGWVIRSTLGETHAGKVVVAAGLGSARLLREHGVRVPLVGAKGYSVTVSGTGTVPAHALYLAEAKLGLSPFDAGLRIAGVFELGGRGGTVPAQAGARLLAAAGRYLRDWEPPRSLPATWAGLRPATADGLPLIGEVPGRPGVYAAAGHTMIGVTLAPATAAALAPLVLRGERAPVLAPFSPGRAA
ncbi:MAG TPA: FAD-dependent oxidoreductase [Gaiellaceae bacterium]|nr:FAD-dependent oxidoreductase [Gaiellaceae bacterium]